MALARERTAGKTFELDRQARGERRLVPARELTAAAPPLAQLRDDCLGADRVGTAAGHAPVEDRVLGVEIAEPPEGAGFERGSQSLAKAHGHDPRMLAPFGRRWVRRQRAASRYSANEIDSDPTGGRFAQRQIPSTRLVTAAGSPRAAWREPREEDPVEGVVSGSRSVRPGPVRSGAGRRTASGASASACRHLARRP